MKRLFLLSTVVGSLLTWSAFGQVDTVTILHINDTHSHLAPVGPRTEDLQGTRGGIARMATLVAMERMSDPNALFIHAGDFSVGDLFYTKYLGVPELRILSAMGLDGMAVGDHEFDLGPAVLTMVLDSAAAGGMAFPLLSANLVLNDPAVQGLGQYIHSFGYRHFGGVKVGFFALTTPMANMLSQPQPAVVDTSIFTTAAAMVDTLQKIGCNVIICISHLGRWMDTQLAHGVSGITVIVGGHNHFALSQPYCLTNPSGDTTWIVQAGSNYLYLGKMRLVCEQGKTRLLDYALIPVNDMIPEDPGVQGVVDNLIMGIESNYGPLFHRRVGTAGTFIGEMSDSLTLQGKHDTPLGNLVADAFRAATGTQLAIETNGSTADPLYPGPITAADVFRAVGRGSNADNGLGFRMATFTMRGSDLWMGLELGVSNIERNDDFLIEVSGMKYSYNSSRPVFGRITSVEAGGAPLDPFASYTITSNEFVPAFLDYVGIPYANLHVFRDTTEFQVLASYLAAIDTIQPPAEGRVMNDVGTSVASPAKHLASSFKLLQNYPNPFNPSTVISYQLTGENRVRLSVFDVLGREVAVLVDGIQQSGEHSVLFDGSRFSSGIYLYRLQAGQYGEMRTMVLLK